MGPAQAQLEPLRQVAQVRPAPAYEEDHAHASEDASLPQPVQRHHRQEPGRDPVAPHEEVRALTSVRQEDQSELATLASNFKAQFNDNNEHRRKWGGGIMGIKSQHVTRRREKTLQLEQAKKLGLQIF